MARQATPTDPSGAKPLIPPGLDPRAWDLAGDLLQPPPDPEASNPWRERSLEALIEQIATLHADCAPVAAFSAPALALLERADPVLCDGPERSRRERILRESADRLRADLVGETVTFVVNRNLNTSNHCSLHCGFCAFRRDPGESGAFRIPLPELERRAEEAQALGATELCLQAALDPEARLDGSTLRFAEHLLRRLNGAAPGIHLHAFSPQELFWFAQSDGILLDQVLDRLKASGLGSVPGTAAEVLSESVRRLICPEKLTARAWVAVIRQVHGQRLPSTATLMAGHVERPADRVAHLLTLLALQRCARAAGEPGFSEFVLLPFVGAMAPAPLRSRVGRDQPDPAAMLRLTALARLLLGPAILHHQPSWVKLTLPVAAQALRWGCDDIGGTLMEEHITTMAGAGGGTAQSPQALREAVQAIGRPVRQRTTLYGQPDRVVA
jgi:FO synthase subunit 2